MDAAERLFARDGIHGARIRDINTLAGQRNPSALHYHFGSRGGLLTAIMLRHQSQIDDMVESRLDELGARSDSASVRDIITAIVAPTVARLNTQSGRDWARIIPQILPALSDNLRRGRAEPTTPQSRRILDLLRDRIAPLPEAVRRERLIAYSVVLTTLLAERAHQVESGRRPSLDERRFVTHLTDVLVAVVTAPSTVDA